MCVCVLCVGVGCVYVWLSGCVFGCWFVGVCVCAVCVFVSVIACDCVLVCVYVCVLCV